MTEGASLIWYKHGQILFDKIKITIKITYQFNDNDKNQCSPACIFYLFKIEFLLIVANFKKIYIFIFLFWISAKVMISIKFAEK